MSPEIYNLTDPSSEFYSMIRGALFFFFFYHIIIYVLNKNKVYLYYSLYSLFLCIFFFSHAHIFDNQPFYYYTDRTFLLLAVSFYFMFTREIVQTEKNIPKWDKVLLKTIPALWLFSVLLILIAIYFDKDTQRNLFFVIMFGTIIISLITSIKLLNINKYHVKLFIFGSLTFLFLLFITLAINVFDIDNYFINLGIHRMFFLYSGAFVEFIVFAILISYRYRKLIEEKTRINSAITWNKIESSELKMMTLKSQLNPHFLFNTLNSINNFILKNQVEEASDFITKFARFIRNVLNNSNQTTITLHEELANLKIYIALEKIRTNNGFEFIEVIADNINSMTTKVPPLFLQPYVENSIWHGISQIQGDKKIWLNVSETNNHLNFNLVDNGIGINKSIELDKLNLYKNKGTATESAKYRINRVFNRKNVVIECADITNDGPYGTRVYISFPKIN
ncbi:MAG: histidine kinase [Flavobacteriaceae bacterium]|nr:histidine kinase [Flavobacteriaceae bacterium]